MNGFMRIIMTTYDLSDDEIWVLSGIDFLTPRQGYEINLKAKAIDILGCGKERVSIKDRDQVLDSLILKGIVEQRTDKRVASVYSSHYQTPSRHEYQDTYILSQEFLEAVPVVCPQGRVMVNQG